eukprot:TRINITY_DN6674_c0_g1_i1.p1 TRINITY_DN6674_c0_g1~~TRINITY_DN6674_c0_g1_i1.p1  ORF type:complete len:315 (-),score=33.78 TRINITY_DN6674_c0_g1_i1:465-1277(-)
MDVMETVFVALLGGNTYTTYRYAAKDPISESTWYRYQNHLLPSIVNAASEVLKETRTKMREAGGKWKAQLNGAWSHRGFKARHHTYMVRNFDGNNCVSAIVLRKDWKKQIVHADGTITDITLPGNYIGTSKGMEPVAFDMALKELREDGIIHTLTTICGDGDLEVDTIMGAHADCSHIIRAFDPGHRQRNLLRALLDVCGQTPFWKGIGYRITKFFMRCIKRAERHAPGNEELRTHETKGIFLGPVEALLASLYTKGVFCPVPLQSMAAV